MFNESKDNTRETKESKTKENPTKVRKITFLSDRKRRIDEGISVKIGEVAVRWVRYHLESCRAECKQRGQGKI